MARQLNKAYSVCSNSVRCLNAKGGKLMHKGGNGLVNTLGLFAEPMKGNAQDLFMGTIHKRRK
jgi:hypothetical protein